MMATRSSQLTRIARPAAAIPRAVAAVLAGSMAIGINTALLTGADLVGFTTARGGLLRLLREIGGRMAFLLGERAWWDATILPLASDPYFGAAFHIAVGILMAIVYAFSLEPYFPSRPWVKGAIYAAVV